LKNPCEEKIKRQEGRQGRCRGGTVGCGDGSVPSKSTGPTYASHSQ